MATEEYSKIQLKSNKFGFFNENKRLIGLEASKSISYFVVFVKITFYWYSFLTGVNELLWRWKSSDSDVTGNYWPNPNLHIICGLFAGKEWCYGHHSCISIILSKHV